METPAAFGAPRGSGRNVNGAALSFVLVSCPRNMRYFVAIKMGRRQGGPSRTGVRQNTSYFGDRTLA
jgi:hypothetical protein